MLHCLLLPLFLFMALEMTHLWRVQRAFLQSTGISVE